MALPVDHHFYVYYCSIADLNGNVSSCATIPFYTVLASTVTTGGYYIYDYTTGTEPAVNLNVSADGRTVTISPVANLGASHHLYYEWCSATDLDGNTTQCSSQGFYTSAGTDTTPPVVINSNPSNNASNAPTNASIEVIFNEAVRATSLTAITLTANGNTIAQTAVLNNSVYTDDTVVRLVPQQLLQPGTTYSVTVSGVQDVAGNTMSGTYTFQFTTAVNFQAEGLLLPAVTVTTGAGTQTLTGSGTLPNVLDSPTFTLVFDHAVDYAALLHSGIQVLNSSDGAISGLTLSFTLSADQKTVTVTTSGLSAATTYHLWVGYGRPLYDVSGNADNFSYKSYYFTTQ